MDAQRYRDLPYLALSGEVGLAELTALAEQYPYAAAIATARAIAARRAGDTDADLLAEEAAARTTDPDELQKLLAQAGSHTSAQPVPELSQADLIDSFLEAAPTLHRPQSDKAAQAPPIPVKDEDEGNTAVPIATEAMASIYLAQGQAGRAAEIYRVLMAQNPGRSAYFADLLRKTGQPLPDGYQANAVEEDFSAPDAAAHPPRKPKKRLFTFMIIAIVSLIVMVALLLILIVLAQDSKTGGFTTGFAGSQLMGVQKTTDLLERLTWGLGVALFVLAISTSFLVDRGGDGTGPNTVNIERARQSGGAVAPAPPQKPADQQAPSGKDTGK